MGFLGLGFLGLGFRNITLASTVYDVMRYSISSLYCTV